MKNKGVKIVLIIILVILVIALVIINRNNDYSVKFSLIAFGDNTEYKDQFHNWSILMY